VPGDDLILYNMKKKIGILGSGNVAKALAKGFLKNNYPLMMGTSNTDKLKDFQSQNSSVQLASFQQTADYADIIVLAVKGDAALSVMKALKPDSVKGKTIIDTCNPIDHTRSPQNGVLPYFTDLNESLMEKLQKQNTDANFVKCFSCVGNAFMVDPDFNGEKPSMFICGNNEGARNDVKDILSDFHWDVEDMGTAEAARAIEPLCMLWCIPGILGKGWNHAFKLLKK
jgi:hypothetical protein